MENRHSQVKGSQTPPPIGPVPLALPISEVELEPVIPLWVVQAAQAAEDREAPDGKRREWQEEVGSELAPEACRKSLGRRAAIPQEAASAAEGHPLESCHRTHSQRPEFRPAGPSGPERLSFLILR